MPKKLLLIDIDDTLCNSSEAYKKAKLKCHEYLQEKYPPIDKDLFMEMYEEAREQIHVELRGTASMHNRFLYFQRMFELLGLTLEPHTLDKMTKIYWNETFENLELYPNVEEALKIVKENNIKIGAITDLIAQVQAEKLEELGISKYIDFIVTSEEAGKEKPHPSIFLLALRKANCLPEEAFMVGDNPAKDIRGANHLGITSVLYLRDGEGGEHADAIMEDFDELSEIMGIEKKERSSREAVIFDMMGTIFKEGRPIKNILVPIMNEMGMDVSYDEIGEVYNKYSVGDISREEFWEHVPREAEGRFLDSLELNDYTLKTIKELNREGYLLGILSNIPEEWGYYLVDKFGLDEYFSTIVFSGEYGARKPDEELYKRFLEEANLKPQNCYLVDDRLVNLKEARYLLMKTVWFKKREPDILFIPDFTIEG